MARGKKPADATDPMEPGQERYASPAARRVMLLLQGLAHSRVGLRVSDFAAHHGLNKSTIFSDLVSLEQMSYVTKDPITRVYRPALSLFLLAQELVRNIPLRRLTRPFMEQLTAQTGFTTHLAALEAGQMVYVDKVEPPGFVRFSTYVGLRVHAHVTAGGKAVLAFLPRARLMHLVEQIGLPKRTPRSITEIPRLLDELALVRARGYSIDDEEDEPEVRCVGAPIFGSDAEVVGAISVTALVRQLPDERLPEVAELVMATAGEITRLLQSGDKNLWG